MKRNKVRNLIIAAVMLGASGHSFGRTFVAITVAPPRLKVYVQPVCPGDGYIWTPGYWAFGSNGYYWVNGAWVLAPQPGYLFTPGYWAFSGGAYIWHRGYWGLTVGYYGGVDYGFGYTGFGFYGGRWDHGHFFYNRAYSNVDERRIHHFYREEARDRDHDRFHDRDHRRDEDRRRDDREHRRDDREHARDHHTGQHLEHAEHPDHQHAQPTRVAHSGGGSRSGYRKA